MVVLRKISVRDEIRHSTIFVILLKQHAFLMQAIFLILRENVNIGNGIRQNNYNSI